MISQPHLTDEEPEAQGMGTRNNLQKASEFILSQELERERVQVVVKRRGSGVGLLGFKPWRCHC